MYSIFEMDLENSPATQTLMANCIADLFAKFSIEPPFDACLDLPASIVLKFYDFNGGIAYTKFFNRAGVVTGRFDYVGNTLYFLSEDHIVFTYDRFNKLWFVGFAHV